MNASVNNSKASAACRTRTRRSMRPLASTLKKCSSIDQRRSSGSDKVPEKLEALKNLISPAATAGKDEEIAADQLFQETACYILRLRTQVVVLQRLVQLYGSSSSNSNEADVVIDVDTAVL